MKTTLELKLGQHLTMTPQLQQAIKLLQLSSLELELEIQEAIEKNPMLDLEEKTNEETEINKEEPKEEDFPIDTAWEDIYPDIATTNTYSQNEKSQDLSYLQTNTDRLQDHLLWQLNLSKLQERDQIIATALIDAISEEGYLTSTLKEIYDGLQELPDITEQEIETVLHLIWHFDPIGVGARTLQECLLIQLNALPSDTPYLSLCKRLLTEHLDLLAQKNYARIKSRLNLTDEVLQQIIHTLTQLNPEPGNQFSHDQSNYVIPDLIVSKKNDSWRVELNKETTPKVNINPRYAALTKQTPTHSNDHKFLQTQLNEAKWFLKSLQNRNETLLKVGSCIMERQRDFLEHGHVAMKPLVLQDIANTVGVHESTVSRITTQKYILTPQGLYELKFFFSSHVNTHTGGECSSTAIRALIKKIIAKESATKPFSDHRIAEFLSTEGIKIARRTVAKYREAMSIPPSNQRKRLL